MSNRGLTTEEQDSLRAEALSSSEQDDAIATAAEEQDVLDEEKRVIKDARANG